MECTAQYNLSDPMRLSGQEVAHVSIIETLEPPRPVPMTAKGRRTRARIVEAAADLIYEGGLREVSLDSVRQASGAGRSQLYHYFASKDDLVHAVIDWQRDRILAAHRPVLSRLSSWEDITSWRDMVVAGQAAHGWRGGCPLGSLANELAETDEPARIQLAIAFAQWHELLADGLAGMIQAGEMRPDADPSRLAWSTLASLQGGLLLAETAREPLALEVALDAAIAHLRTFATTAHE